MFLSTRLLMSFHTFPNVAPVSIFKLTKPGFFVGDKLNTFRSLSLMESHGSQFFNVPMILP